MANTLGGVNVAEIAQRGFPSFKAALAPINAFSTSFDSEAARKNESVTTHVVSAVSAQTFSDYETGNSTTTAKTVTLNQHKIGTAHLTDVEAGKTPIDLLAALAGEAAYAVGKSIVDYALGLITAATYGDTSADKVTVAAGSFDADTVADMVKLANDANLPESSRSLILNNAYINALQKDNALQDASALGSDAVIREGAISQLLGASVYRTGSEPSAWTSDNTTGILVHPSALAVACRPVVPQDQEDVAFELVTDPESGLSLGFRMHYSRSTGAMWINAEALYGASAVQVTAAKRVESA